MSCDVHPISIPGVANNYDSAFQNLHLMPTVPDPHPTRMPRATLAEVYDKNAPNGQRPKEMKEAQIASAEPVKRAEKSIPSGKARDGDADSSSFTLDMTATMRQYRIIMLGDTNVGKTWIARHWSQPEKFNHQIAKMIRASISVDMCARTCNVDGEQVRVELFDTAGQERFDALSSGYFRRQDGAILVYDITNAHSFDKMKAWLKKLRDNEEPREEARGVSTVIIVGNKSDLGKTGQRQVSEAKGMEFARIAECSFMETSALDGTNIEAAINMIVRDIYELQSTRAGLDTEEDDGKSFTLHASALLSRQEQGIHRADPNGNNPDATLNSSATDCQC